MAESMSKQSKNRGVANSSQQAGPIATRTTTETTQWQGPIPPPAALEHFDSVIPGGAARILKMAEDEQAHRIAFEKAALMATVADTRRGQWLGGAIGASAIIGAVVAAALGAPWQVPVALVGVPVLGIVQALITGTSSKRSGSK